MFGLTGSFATGMPLIDAQDDFRRARLAAALGHCLTGRRGREGRLRALPGEPLIARGPLALTSCR